MTAMKRLVTIFMSCIVLAACDFSEGTANPPEMSTAIQRDFSSAIYDNNLQKVREYIESGKISVNENFPYGQKPLHKAAYSGKLEVIKYLVKNGADINAKTTGSLSTPLHRAIKRGHEDAAILLLDLGADPSINYGRYTTCYLAKRMSKWADMPRLIARLPGCRDAPLDAVNCCQSCSK